MAACVLMPASTATLGAGIGPSLLVARLATRKGKPNGQYRVASGQVLAFLADLPVDQLPGETAVT
jgi:DNA repair protein REV1